MLSNSCLLNFLSMYKFRDASDDRTNVGKKVVISPSVFAIFPELLDFWLELGDESDVEMMSRQSNRIKAHVRVSNRAKEDFNDLALKIVDEWLLW
jgi:hypothetical protein